jgi:hypothetical protein
MLGMRCGRLGLPDRCDRIDLPQQLVLAANALDCYDRAALRKVISTAGHRVVGHPPTPSCVRPQRQSETKTVIGNLVGVR